MAAPGQRIHPAGSRHPDLRHAATPPSEALDATREHDACGVGFVAHASGVRSHEVVSMALEAVARVAHRGAASTDNSGDGAGLLTQIPHRLFYRDAYRLGLHLQPGLPFGVGAFFFPREPDFLHFRCHVGHAFSEEALFASQSRALEGALWSAVRALEEKAALSRRLAKQAGNRGLQRAAAQFHGAAREAEHGSNILRHTLLKSPGHEPLDAEAEPEDKDVAALSREPELR
jgi:glutamate synthase domain-containing protein 1